MILQSVCLLMETIQRNRKFNPRKKKRFARIQLSKQEWSRKSHGWRGLVGCSPWCWEESDTTEQLNFHFSLWWIGEANGNPLQCSCSENPRDRGGGGGLEGCCLWGCTESDMTEATYQQQQHPRSVCKTNSLTVTEVKSYEERLAWWINGYGSI